MGMRIAWIVGVGLAAIYVVGSAGAQGENGSAIQSSKIRALATAVHSGDERAVEEFWSAVESETTPIIEPINGDADHALLTVLWRGDAETENVLLVGSLTREHPLESTLENIPGSDVWYLTYRTRRDLRATYQFSPNDPLVMVPMDDAEAVAKQRRNYQRDPLNPNRHLGSSLVELPDAPEQRWIAKNPAAPEGEVRTEAEFASAVLGNTRRISVYVPPGYDPDGAPYPLVLVFDQSSYLTLVPTPTILDNLIHAGELKPVVAVLVGNPPGARNDELPCNDDFVSFLASELVPWVREQYNVASDPSKNVIAGSSFGGLAASYVGLRHPELFGNVLSQSGSYWWSPETNTIFLEHEVEGEWLTRQYAEEDHKPLRFFIEVGLNEGGAPSMVIVNRHFRDVLVAKDYEIVEYDEFNGGHDYLNWRGSFGEGLIALIGAK